MTSIEWVKGPDGAQGKTWNPIRGCTRVSPGCGGPGPHGGCYAEGIAARFSDREASALAVLRALTREVWPQITALSEDEVARIPGPVMDLLRGVFFAGASGALPHEDAIAESRERAAWAEAVSAGQRTALDRLAALADPLHAAAGARPFYRPNRYGHPIRDHGADLDRIEAALALPPIPSDQSEDAGA